MGALAHAAISSGKRRRLRGFVCRGRGQQRLNLFWRCWYIQLMHIVINGQSREFADLAASATLADLVAALELKGDRVAIEHNGSIVSRAEWTGTAIYSGDKFEIVHFVGGGVR
jgi:sulfur carrier protein